MVRHTIDQRAPRQPSKVLYAFDVRSTIVLRTFDGLRTAVERT